MLALLPHRVPVEQSHRPLVLMPASRLPQPTLCHPLEDLRPDHMPPRRPARQHLVGPHTPDPTHSLLAGQRLVGHTHLPYKSLWAPVVHHTLPRWLRHRRCGALRRLNIPWPVCHHPRYMDLQAADLVPLVLLRVLLHLQPLLSPSTHKVTGATFLNLRCGSTASYLSNFSE